MKTEKLNQVLIIIIGILAAFIIIGTIFGINKKQTQTPQVLISKGKAINLAAPSNTQTVEYFQLKSIRIITEADSSKKEITGTPFVITPWLAYPQGDTVFYEELARKQGTIKAIFTQYFTQKKQNEILSLGEEKIVKELLEIINAQLSLGKISDIFFTDFIFL